MRQTGSAHPPFVCEAVTRQVKPHVVLAALSQDHHPVSVWNFLAHKTPRAVFNQSLEARAPGGGGEGYNELFSYRAYKKGAKEQHLPCPRRALDWDETPTNTDP